jgi:hypothetical protein
VMIPLIENARWDTVELHPDQPDDETAK